MLPTLVRPGMFDLFGAPPVPGLSAHDAIIAIDEEAALIARIDAENLSAFRFQGWLGKRLTRSFGWHYDFEDGSLGETDPVPGWLEPVRDRAAAFASLNSADLVQALVIRYDPGAGIGWHRDRPMFEHVVGISLGNATTMRLRRRNAAGFQRASVPLLPRSAYHLSGEVREQWEHSIAAMDLPRWSITFRSLRNPPPG